MYTQKTNLKNSYFKVARAKDPKFNLPCTNAVKPLKQEKKDWKDKKKKFQQRKKWKDTPATGNNAIDVSKKKKKN